MFDVGHVAQQILSNSASVRWQRVLAYALQGAGIPPVLSDITTAWQVNPNGDNQSVVTTTFEAKLANPEMSDALSGRVMQGLEPLLEELKHYAETGQPHPRKQEQLAVQ